MDRFGHISKFPEGSTFKNRNDVKSAGLHNMPVHGISRVPNIGADCIVLNGGYVDDEDKGDIIIYTGEGGRRANETKHTFKQELVRGNKDLALNKINNLPVRVIRGPRLDSDYKTKSGYRYDGLYKVDKYWPHSGIDGFIVWKYKLVKINNNDIEKITDETPNKPSRRQSTSEHIIRNQQLAEDIKILYDYSCQVCSKRLEGANNTYGVHAAHIKDLGRPHNGPDIKSNMLCLCLNHHFLLDNYGFSINDDFSLIGIEGNLNIHDGHNINLEYIQYKRGKYTLANNG